MSTASVPAGDFSQWLRGAIASMETGKGATPVPCGKCDACCRSSMFVHIHPQETRTIRSIPRELLFPSPGLPKGHVLLGYDAKGRCPMLRHHKCAIYRQRPQTCRTYDCRIFAATGIDVDERLQPGIAERVKAWIFEYENEEAREQHRILRAAAAFLRDHKDLFPKGTIPAHPAPLAALALRVYPQFASPREPAALVDAIREAVGSNSSDNGGAQR